MNSLCAFITTNGDTILGTLHTTEDDSGLVYIIYPVKMSITPVATPAGIYTQHLPSLYQPFGSSAVVPFKSSFFASIQKASAFDERFYDKILEQLLMAETKRLLTLDRMFNDEDYRDRHIWNTPTTIQ